MGREQAVLLEMLISEIWFETRKQCRGVAGIRHDPKGLYDHILGTNAPFTVHLEIMVDRSTLQSTLALAIGKRKMQIIPHALIIFFCVSSSSSSCEIADVAS